MISECDYDSLKDLSDDYFADSFKDSSKIVILQNQASVPASEM